MILKIEAWHKEIERSQQVKRQHFCDCELRVSSLTEASSSKLYQLFNLKTPMPEPRLGHQYENMKPL